MYYFVSAWYPSGRTWYEDTDVWYMSSQRLRYDDTINQLRLFGHAGEPASLVTLNYMPNFRLFKHRYGLTEIPSWSAFDRIQDTLSVKPQRLDFWDLNWPKGVDFIYNFFAVMVQLKGQVIAKVEFGPEGQLLFINYLDQGQLTHRYVFDDRGFLSSILYFEEGQAAYQEYLNSYGQWQIREYLGERTEIVINPRVSQRFRATTYPSMAALMAEVFAGWVDKELDEDDRLVLAADPRHNDLVLNQLKGQLVISSFFQNRMPLSAPQAVKALADQSRVLLVDQLSTKTDLETMVACPVEHLSPFDSRLSLGKSQRLKDLILYFLVDGLTPDQRDTALAQCFDAMRHNPAIELMVVTYDDEQAQEIKAWLQEQLDQADEAWLSLKEAEAELEQFELEMPGDHKVSPRVRFAAKLAERDIMAAMQQVRLVVDLAQEPNLYTQIAAISSGIPQINRRQSEFVAHKKNGYVIDELTDLTQALAFYLDGLAHWNEALVYAVEKISDYTSGRLVDRLLEQVDKNS